MDEWRDRWMNDVGVEEERKGRRDIGMERRMNGVSGWMDGGEDGVRAGNQRGKEG